MADNAETKIETPAVADAPVAVEAAPEAPVAAPKLPKARKAAAPKAVKPAVKAAKPAKAKPAKTARKAAEAPKVAKVKKTAAATKTAKFPTFNQIKDKLMAAKTPDFTKAINDAMADAQDKAKAAYDKGVAAFGDYNDFSKGNVEAIVESGKILATGLKEMGGVLVQEGKAAFETVTADVKELAAIKSPADLFKFQGELLRRNFDAAVAFGSKQTEAVIKLAGDAAAPLSTRVSLAVEKVKKAA